MKYKKKPRNKDHPEVALGIETIEEMMMNKDEDQMNENKDLKNRARPYVKFILQGEPVDPDLITEVLGVLPARRFKKGDPYGKKGNKWPLVYGVSLQEIWWKVII